jgi:uncharacterized membrane protein
MEKNINLVATFHIVMSGLSIFAGLIVFGILAGIGSFTGCSEATPVLMIIAVALLGFLVLISIPGIIAGIGLYNRKEWARILTIILSILQLFNIPLGTALGVYSLYVLTQPEVLSKFNPQ